MKRLLSVLSLIGALALPAVAQAADDGPDLIFRKSTVFKLLTPNDKLATYAIDDPDVEGVACHYTVPSALRRRSRTSRSPAASTGRSRSRRSSSRAPWCSASAAR